ncbi:hypothetical protein TNCV_4603731 [Trichonephila clavipes]|nr:hypothetical protein TNCV_4603731 [Trichonephila clavipes]
MGYIDSFFEVSPERNEINQNTENGVLSNFDINNVSVEIENDNSILLQTTSSPQTGKIQLPRRRCMCYSLLVMKQLIVDDKVCKLKKNICGLPQSRRNCPGSSTSASSVRSLNPDLHNNLRYRGVESDLRVSLVNKGLVGPYSATVLVALSSAPDHRPPLAES